MAAIQIIPSTSIDPSKWDACLAADPDAPVYATRLFLDKLCDHWSALVIQDYQAVLPIPWRKKFGIRYSYAPPFIQQLGLIGTLKNIPPEDLLQALTDFIAYGDLFWNHCNHWITEILPAQARNNFVLSLQASHPEIAGQYSKELLYNLKKAEKSNLIYRDECTIQDAINLYQTQYGERFPHIVSSDYLRLREVADQLVNRQDCLIRSVYRQEEMLAVALIVVHCKKLYLLLNATSPNGRALSANHFLIDQLIREFCEEERSLDFEGSDLEGVQHFYQSFHPENQPYFYSRINTLPWFIRWGLRILNK